MSDEKFKNALEIQMALGKVALESTCRLLSNKWVAEETTPFSLADGSKFEVTIRRV
ncbi:hypothetical protein FFRU_260050 [Fructobacillus fructosus]|uniref:hypothetical protein n=1 Tax=Fructobacillus fructosus TaxID=1631 RepID=UPI0002195CB0|nr:hypothetical protein [Fructobacillus fructosus]GAP02023.1 hypothetical protein FFRU_260050 [Fructobacillus fructosus]